MHASTSRNTGSSKLSGPKQNHVGLRKRTRDLQRPAGGNSSQHHHSHHDSPYERDDEHEVVEQLSPISDSSKEYGFDRDETVDTSINEDETDVKTPTGLESPVNGSPIANGKAAEKVLGGLLGTNNRASQRSARRPTDGYEAPSPLAPGASKSWYEFDLAVVIALVSPVGSWLTGGDHVKKLLLVVLVVYYLHQIIEIPWDLYHKARPRRRGLPHTVPSENSRFHHLARGELRRMESLFLFLAVASPIIGALLLRYATSEVLGEDAISWFSTGLFILATGMRPWRHLVDRLSHRTTELQDFIHYPELHDKQQCDSEQTIRQALLEVEGRLQKLERKMRKAKRELLDINDDMLEFVDGAGKKHDKRYDKYEMRLKALETTIHDLQTRGMRGRRCSNGGSEPLFLQLKHSVEDSINWALEATYPTSTLARHRKGKGLPLATIREEEDVDSAGVEPQVSVTQIPSPRSTVFRVLHGAIFFPAKLANIFAARVFRLLSFPLRAAYRMAAGSSR